MSRETKFRAWDKKFNCMIHGPHDTFIAIVTSAGVFKLDATSQTDRYLPMPADRFELMQWTGLKDENGKEIYEGDIVKYFVEHNGPAGDETAVETFIEEVSFVDGQFCVDGYAPVNYFPCEVIGDVHRNPELLNK